VVESSFVLSGHVHLVRLAGGGDSRTERAQHAGRDDVPALNVGLHGGVEAAAVGAVGARPNIRRLDALHHGANKVVQR